MPKNLKQSTKENIAKILFIIKKAPGIHVRAIARTLNMHPITVSSIIDRYLIPFLDVQTDRYGAKLKAYYLKEDKENITLEDVLRYYLVRKNIKHSNV